MENLLSTACMLQLSEVVEACCNFLMKQLHPSNCIGIRQFADAQGCSDLYKVANNYVMVCTTLTLYFILRTFYGTLVHQGRNFKPHRNCSGWVYMIVVCCRQKGAKCCRLTYLCSSHPWGEPVLPTWLKLLDKVTRENLKIG